MQKLIFSFYLVDPWDLTQVIKLGGKGGKNINLAFGLQIKEHSITEKETKEKESSSLSLSTSSR